MNKQQQAHQLRASWSAEDSATHAYNSAQTAQKYHQLISQKANAIDAELTALRQHVQTTDRQTSIEIQSLKAENKRLEGLIDGSRNQCLVWGIGGAIAGSIVFSLLFSPNNAPTMPQSRPSIQRGIFE